MKQTAHVSRIPVIKKGSRAMFALLAAALVVFALQHIAPAQGAERSGKEVVTSTCGNCHTTGVDGAPKIGDKQAWSKLSGQGLSGLTKIVLTGIRKMPPHGANMKLTDTEIKRAVTYMINQSGGHWIEPTSKTNPPAPRTGLQIVQMQCFKCHEKGLNGAPKIGDIDAWLPRLKNGFEPVVRSAINGHGAMPARGGLADLTDDEMRSAITYMFNKGRVPEKAAK